MGMYIMDRNLREYCMNTHELFSLICALSVILGIIGEKRFKLQPTITLLIISFLIALFCKYTPLANTASFQVLITSIQTIHFNEIFLSYMLGLMLYAGAIHINTQEFIKRRWEISVLALSATLLSIISIGAGVFYLSEYLNYDLDLLECMLFGAIISPTDPIAVLGLMKELKAPKDLSTIIAGESLFNDGIGIVAFTVLVSAKLGHIDLTLWSFIKSFIVMSLGGVLLGAIISYLTHILFERCYFSTSQKIMITIAQIIGGYEICEALHISGALYAVVLGIANGYMLSKREENQVMQFWDIIDEFLNLVLFLLIGFEVLSLDFNPQDILFGTLTIFIVLGCRFLLVNANINILHLFKTQPKHIGHVISWAGLRGGLAVALAISLPITEAKDNKILLITYIVVLFSVIVQVLHPKEC